MVDKEVEGIDMLFDQTLDLEKSWQEVPFVLYESTRVRDSIRYVKLNLFHTSAVLIGSVKLFPQ